MGYIISKSNYWWQLLDIHKKYNWHIIDAGLIDPIGKINDVALPTKSIWLVIFLLMYSLYINHKICIIEGLIDLGNFEYNCIRETYEDSVVL